MRRTLAPGLAALGLTAAPAFAGERTVILAVENMTCPACPCIVQRTLAAVPGVIEAEVAYERKTAKVTFDDTKTTLASLTEATAKAGYPSKPQQWSASPTGNRDMETLATTAAPEASVLRTGVLMPDWSLITARSAKQALQASFRITNRKEKWRDLARAEDRVWQAVLRAFRATGRSPDRREIADRSGLDRAAVSRWFRALERRDLIVLDRAGAVSAAYPFCNASTGHRVRFRDQVVNALCAIDALGAGAMFASDTMIESSCPQCSAAIRIRTGERGLVILDVAPAEAVVWFGLQYAGGCAATSGCKVKTFFCSDEHLRAWRDRGDRHGGGFRLSVEEAAQVGMAMFVPMLAQPQ